MSKEPIHSDQAPAAIGPYSQAVRHGTLVFLSGQIPLDPETMELVGGGIDAQIRRVLDSLQAVCTAAGGSLQQILKINVYLTDLAHFPVVNSIMDEYFDAPFPARAAVGVASLPRGAEVEMEAVMGL
ncbi:MAG TPA: RidA family protein [Xanthomonadales bacterium]|nr:RidA family protein [Xanthomonadales bacterium]